MKNDETVEITDKWGNKILVDCSEKTCAGYGVKSGTRFDYYFMSSPKKMGIAIVAGVGKDPEIPEAGLQLWFIIQDQERNPNKVASYASEWVDPCYILGKSLVQLVE